MTQWCNEAGFLLGSNSTEFEFHDLARDRLYSWTEFSTAVEQKYSDFGEAGFQKGDGVLITQGNSFEFLVDLVAALARHAVVIVADGRLTDAELGQVTKLSEPKFQFGADGSLIESPTFKSTIAGPALVLLTSGTSAAPKLVVLTPQALTARIVSIDAAIPRADRANSLCLLPTHFGHGLIGVCLSSLYSGVRLAMAPRLEQAVLPQLEAMITRARPSFLSGTPATWETVLRYTSIRTDKLRRAQIASAPAASQLFEQVKSWAGCSTYNVYGMTETASWVSAQEFLRTGDERGVGDGSKFKTEFRLENVSDGFGDVFVRTDGMFLGYWQEIIGDPSSLPAQQQRWYATGDRGHIDDSGALHLSGRQGRVINRRGVKVSSEEVELAVKSLPFVEDAVVLAVGPHNDSVGVLVVPKAGSSRTENEFLTLISEALESRLSAYKLPTRIWFADQIPRRTNGKPDLIEIGRICGLK